MGFVSKKFNTLVASIGIAISSIIDPVEVKSTNIDPITRKESAGDQDIIGSEDAWKSQGKWLTSEYFDRRMYKYTKLDNLVNFQDNSSGRYWENITHREEVIDGIPYFVLDGIRDDGDIFSSSARIDLANNDVNLLNTIFDGLCDSINKNLDIENSQIESRVGQKLQLEDGQ